MTYGSVLQKLQFLVRFLFYKINRSFGFLSSVRPTFVCRLRCHLLLQLYGMTLEMTYFHAELVQLIVSRSDSELEVQRYGMKKNTLTVDPNAIMLEDEF